MSLIESVRPLKGKLTAIRRDIHAHPELAFAEHRTAELVARQLESLGIETHRGIGGTGVVGVVRGRRGPLAAGEHLETGLDVLVDVQALDEVSESVFDEDAQDLTVPVEVAVGPPEDPDFSDTQHSGLDSWGGRLQGDGEVYRQSARGSPRPVDWVPGRGVPGGGNDYFSFPMMALAMVFFWISLVPS